MRLFNRVAPLALGFMAIGTSTSLTPAHSAAAACPDCVEPPCGFGIGDDAKEGCDDVSKEITKIIDGDIDVDHSGFLRFLNAGFNVILNLGGGPIAISLSEASDDGAVVYTMRSVDRAWFWQDSEAYTGYVELDGIKSLRLCQTAMAASAEIVKEQPQYANFFIDITNHCMNGLNLSVSPVNTGDTGDKKKGTLTNYTRPISPDVLDKNGNHTALGEGWGADYRELGEGDPEFTPRLVEGANGQYYEVTTIPSYAIDYDATDEGRFLPPVSRPSSVFEATANSFSISKNEYCQIPVHGTLFQADGDVLAPGTMDVKDPSGKLLARRFETACGDPEPGAAGMIVQHPDSGRYQPLMMIDTSQIGHKLQPFGPRS